MNKNKLVHGTCILLLVCLFSITTHAQTLQWTHQAGGVERDDAGGIDVDDSGNSYVTGKFFKSIAFGTTILMSPGNALYLAKYYGNGDLAWAKVIATGSTIYANGIAVGKSGNITVVGRYLEPASFGAPNPVELNSSGDFDVFIASYNNTGDVIWAKSAGGPGFDYGSGISKDAIGNVYITGEFHISSYSGSAAKIFVAKYDQAGNCPWFKMPENYGNFHLGNAIKTTAAGDSYFSGQFFNLLDLDSNIVLNVGNNPEANGYIGKINSQGIIQWMKSIGANTGYAGAEGIDIDKDGNACVTGFYRGQINFGNLALTGPSGISYDVFVAKCDKDGHFLWVNKASGAGAVDEGVGVSADNEGGFYVTGYFTETMTFGSIELPNAGSLNIYVVRIDSAGDFVWATECGGPVNTAFGSIKISGIQARADEVFLTGNFTNTIYFEPNDSLVPINSNSDVFIVKWQENVTSIQETNDKKDITLFPNPVTSEIKLTGVYAGEKYKIFNAQGDIQMQGMTGNNNSIIVGFLESGIYFLQVYGGANHRQFSQIKFVKI